MGYGSRAIDMLCEYFQGNISMSSIPKVGVFGGEGSEAPSHPTDSHMDIELQEEEIKPRAKLPPLLTALGKTL